MRRALAVAIALSVAELQPAAQPPAASALTRTLDAALARFPARTGIYVKHLQTGEEAAVRADDSFNSQSVIKIPIMVRAFQMADAGALDLDARVPLHRADLRDGTGILQFHDDG